MHLYYVNLINIIIKKKPSFQMEKLSLLLTLIEVYS